MPKEGRNVFALPSKPAMQSRSGDWLKKWSRSSAVGWAAGRSKRAGVGFEVIRLAMK